MNKLLKLVLLLLVIGCKTNHSKTETIIVNYDDSKIYYEGRIGENENKTASEIYWSGSSMKVNFEGTEVKVTLEDENGTNYFNVIIDGASSKILKLEKGKKTYQIASNLSDKKHSVLLTKRNEWTYGKTLFYNFEIKGRLLDKDSKKKLFIEYYGDSITTGHGNEDYTGEDEPDGSVTNNYNTYAAITARNINAEYSCIARGGIGIMVSWFNMIMPEMYDRLNPNDSESKWDFRSKQPDIVVINLLQNDSWIVNQPEHQEFKRRFGNNKPNDDKIINDYKSFIQKIRAVYKDASIICLLGNMDITKKDSKWPDYVEQAVNSLNDTKIHTCFVPYKETSGHPKVEEHEIIANKLTLLIYKKMIKRDQY